MHLNLDNALICVNCETLYAPNDLTGYACPVCGRGPSRWLKKWLSRLADPVKRRPSEIVREELYGSPSLIETEL